MCGTGLTMDDGRNCENHAVRPVVGAGARTAEGTWNE